MKKKKTQRKKINREPALAVTVGSATLIRKLGFFIEERAGIPILQWTWPSCGCRPAEETELALWQELTKPNHTIGHTEK